MKVGCDIVKNYLWSIYTSISLLINRFRKWFEWKMNKFILENNENPKMQSPTETLGSPLFVATNQIS